jgi:hypothetical protein
MSPAISPTMSSLALRCPVIQPLVSVSKSGVQPAFAALLNVAKIQPGCHLPPRT